MHVTDKRTDRAAATASCKTLGWREGHKRGCGLLWQSLLRRFDVKREKHIKAIITLQLMVGIPCFFEQWLAYRIFKNAQDNFAAVRKHTTISSNKLTTPVWNWVLDKSSFRNKPTAQRASRLVLDRIFSRSHATSAAAATGFYQLRRPALSFAESLILRPGRSLFSSCCWTRSNAWCWRRSTPRADWRCYGHNVARRLFLRRETLPGTSRTPSGRVVCDRTMD